MYHLVPQVLVAHMNYLREYGHYLSVWEADGNVQVCLKTNGMIRVPLYIDIETTEWNTNATGLGYKPARGKCNIYRW